MNLSQFSDDICWIFRNPSCDSPVGKELWCRRPRFNSWVGKILWRRTRLPIPVFLGFPCGLVGKEFHLQCGRTWVLSLLWEEPLEKGKVTHASILAWRIPWTVYIFHGVTKSWTWLCNFHFTSLELL